MNVDLLIATYEYVAVDKERFASEFYSQLFVMYPEVYHLFVRRDVGMYRQQQLLMSTLKAVVYTLKQDKKVAIAAIKALGRRHQGYGVSKVSHYDAVGDVLIKTFKKFMRDAWTPDKEKAWKEAYAVIKKTMIESYEKVY